MKHAFILTKKEFLDMAQSNALLSPAHIIHTDSDINCYMLRFDSESAAERFRIICGEHPLFDENGGVDYVSADVFLDYAKDVLLRSCPGVKSVDSMLPIGSRHLAFTVQSERRYEPC